MSRRYKYLFTEEWDEGGKVHVAAYGKIKRSEIDDILEQQEKYSPYDYVDSVETDSEEEYNQYLQVRIDNGAEVKYYNKV